MSRTFGVPEEFWADAIHLGYRIDGFLHNDWNVQENAVINYAAQQGMTVYLEGRRIWATDLLSGDEYLLASATDSDPMNLWAQAYQKIDYIRNAHIPMWVHTYQ